jgi:ferredoxin
MKVKVKVKVDRESCIGVSNCVAIAPTVFKLDDQNKALVLDPSSVDEESLMEAAKSCPENAIILQDDEGNQSYP